MTRLEERFYGLRDDVEAIGKANLTVGERVGQLEEDRRMMQLMTDTAKRAQADRRALTSVRTQIASVVFGAAGAGMLIAQGVEMLLRGGR